MTSTTPLDALLDEMNMAVEANLNLVALSVAVAIPAICASLTMENGRSNGEDYKAWCKANLTADNGFKHLTSEELYSLRCGVLHQGQASFGDLNKKAISFPHPHSKAIFTIENGGMKIGENTSNDQYINSVKIFCHDISSAARTWLEAEASNETVQTNLLNMMNYKPFQGTGFCISPAPMAIF